MVEQNRQYQEPELLKIEIGGIVVEESLKSNTLRVKRLLRYLPMIMAGLHLLNVILSYFDIDVSIISYLSGVGLIPLVFIFLASYMFKFCVYHRMFLWYIVANDIISWVDFNYGIPLSNWGYLVLHYIIAGIFLFIIIYLKFTYCPNKKER